jgi:hypothetical protein
VAVDLKTSLQLASLSSGYTANPSEKTEMSDTDDLPAVGEIVARSKSIIDLSRCGWLRTWWKRRGWDAFVSAATRTDLYEQDAS